MESWHTTNHMIWVFEKIWENEDEQSHQSLVVNGGIFPGVSRHFHGPSGT